ncbi:sensor histidine kinase [Aureliella helgolandensis]|nr:HAMP domain-containing sensor histidine kinase [Aureliella helgolandensis]
MLIRKKILLSTVLLTVTLLLLVYCSLRSAYAYRDLTLVVEQLAGELEASSDLRFEMDELLRLSSTVQRPSPSSGLMLFVQTQPQQRLEFHNQVHKVDTQLGDYEHELVNKFDFDHLLSDRSPERKCVSEIRRKLDGIKWLCNGNDPAFFSGTASWLQNDMQLLMEDVRELPTFILERMKHFRGEVRSRYRALIIIITFSSAIALTIVAIMFWFFRNSVVQPFKTLLSGSRQIARGDFNHRIYLSSQDELSELADALNKMTSSFVEIQQNLNEKVQERSREVVRSEQLASVGFLAAGVAHEINNPLASIAWSAEALESRLHEILHRPAEITEEDSTGETSQTALSQRSNYDDQQIEVLRKYLARIQDEAFRCKGITERLLDFSRLGETQRKQPTEIDESVSDVIALVKHLGQYRNKKLEYIGQAGVTAEVSPTEFKQVVLNLLTNSLDACEEGGVVRVRLQADQECFTLEVSDNGCGMTQEVLKHLFEPFFTRRRDGRGTGLGLSISYRIVQDHGGTLVPASSGPGQGSQLTLTLPLRSTSSTSYERFKAAA